MLIARMSYTHSSLNVRLRNTTPEQAEQILSLALDASIRKDYFQSVIGKMHFTNENLVSFIILYDREDEQDKTEQERLDLEISKIELDLARMHLEDEKAERSRIGLADDGEDPDEGEDWRGH